ncbi:MAG TPA: sulfite exporter TauE/SafE family protein, partial [Gemmataceae bacterium]|nr:sulfite exporter TauE/SafE family protein [Gemmataceae bacterium]
VVSIATAYVKEGFSNIRIGMLLEIGTTLGALGGAFLGAVVPAAWLSIIFGVVLLLSAYLSRRPHAGEAGDLPPDPLAARLRLDSTYPTPEGRQAYHVQNVPGGFALMVVAGVLSGLLGIGSGAFKVLALDRLMKLPFKVSTTTSNFMIGVTAAASAGVYLGRGYIDPGVAMPVMLGVLLGSFLGSKVLVTARVRVLRLVFVGVILLLGVEMIYNGVMALVHPGTTAGGGV